MTPEAPVPRPQWSIPPATLAFGEIPGFLRLCQMTRVLIAAGGGGDALAAAILHRTTPLAAPAVIATYAWDHLVTDPVPGPRRTADFTRLDPLAGRDRAFSAETRP